MTRKTESRIAAPAAIGSRHHALDAGESVTTTDASSDQPGDSRAPVTASVDRGASLTEPEEFRAQLALAHERLSSYVGIDRQIAEHVRRSGELMVEMLAMRETTTASVELANQRERVRIGAGLDELDSAVQAIRMQIDAVAGQVSHLRQSLGTEPLPREHGPGTTPAKATLPQEPTLDVPTGGGWNAPQVIEVIVHHVNRATIALSLQRYLGNLDSVAGVEAREFAEGVLRMQVTAHQALTGADIAGWTEGGSFSVLQMQPNLVELTLDGGV